MKIGIDLTAMDPEYVGGINTYIQGLLSGLSESISSSDNVFVFIKDDCNSEIIKLVHLLKMHAVFIKPAKLSWGTRFIRKMYHIFHIKNSVFLQNLMNRTKAEYIEEICDILYFPTTVLDYFHYRIPTVVSMHDIQHVHFPDFFTKEELAWRIFFFRATIRHATCIQVSSNYIKNDIMAYYPSCKESLFMVIPEGVNYEQFANKTDIDIVSKYHLPMDFIFLPAQLWLHKNHLTLLKALQKLNNSQYALVLTGGKFSASNVIFNFIHENHLDSVYYLGKVPFPDLVALYQKAKFLVMPSLHESSSLPILEAAAAGLPILSSDIESLLEMSKYLEINYFSALDADDLAKKIESLWNDPASLHKQASINQEKIHQLEWGKIADSYLTCFSHLIPSSKR